MKSKVTKTKTKTKTKTTVTLYRGNRIDRAFEQPLSDLPDLFKKHEAYQNYKNGWPLDRAIPLFIGDKESNNGLNSSYDFNDYTTMRNAIKEGITPKCIECGGILPHGDESNICEECNDNDKDQDHSRDLVEEIAQDLETLKREGIPGLIIPSKKEQ